MPKPSLPVGTIGRISVRQIGPECYEARARHRTFTGQTRQARAVGCTEDEARRNIVIRVFGRRGGAGQITADSTVAELAAEWLADEHDWSTGTLRTYTAVLDADVLPALGEVRVAEARPVILDRALKAIRREHGAGAAKTSKTVLSGMFQVAVLHDALAHNPVKDVSRLSGGRKRQPRALTVEQAAELRALLHGDAWAAQRDLPDLVHWMLGTGMRIGETLAVRSEVLLAGTVEVDATLVRVKGVGLVVQRRPKSAAGWRVLALPSSLTAMLDRRRKEARFRAPEGVVFGAPFTRALRDPNNTMGDLRLWLDRNDYPWVTSHTFRKTVATRLDEAGLSSRIIADVLGHAKPSMTQDHYMGRGVVSVEAARVLG